MTENRGVQPPIEGCENDMEEYARQHHDVSEFQTCCIDKPCMHLYDVCTVKSECDTLKQCEENWRFLRENPNVAENNKKNRERIEYDRNKKERERVLKIAIGLIKHEGFLDIGYDQPIVFIPDVERCFDAIRKVDDAKGFGDKQ